MALRDRTGVHRRHGAPSNLPAELSSFVGREQQVRRGVHLVASARLLTLCGPGGSGKSRLARQIAQGSAGTAPDGIWWVELADEDVVVPALARAMTLPVSTSELTAYVGDARVVLVLDNCEHLLPSIAGQIEVLLRATGDVRVLATSREPLGVEGERVWRIPPLEVPPAGAAAVDAIDYESVRLFSERAAAAGAFVDASDPQVGGLCRALDGMPLAVELAAARAAALPVGAILAGLEDRFSLLAGGPRTAPDRLRSLRASLEWSHELSTQAERVMLRRLAVFDGGFDADAAVSVADVEPLSRGSAVEALIGLVAKSLVQVDGARYRLLETIRAFARERLVEAEEAATLADRHLAWVRAFAETREPATLRCDVAVLDELESELPNLRAALAHAGRAGTRPDGLRLVSALAFFRARRGYGVSGMELDEADAAVDLARPGASRARAWWAVAYARFYGGCFALAGEIVSRAVAEEHDDSAVRARCQALLGGLTLFTDPAAARSILSEALAGAQQAGDRWGERHALGLLAFSHEVQHRPVLARPFNARLADETELDPYDRAWVDLATGMDRQLSGELAGARDAYAAARAWAEASRDPLLVLYACAGQAAVALHAGTYHELPGIAAAMSRPEMRFDDLTLSFAATLREVARLADELDELGGPVEALITGGTAVAAYVPAEAPRLVLAGARLAMARGELDLAAAAAEGTRAACATAGSAMTGPCLVVLARVARCRNNTDDIHTTSSAQDALALIVEAELWADLPEALAVIGALAVDAGRAADGVRLLAAAESLATTMGCAPTDITADRRRAQEALGEEFSEVWGQGRMLDRHAAITYARRARGPRRRPSHGWASLSPAELEVVRLAAAGLPNPLIAERLFVSRATVKTHLVHVFAKLGLTTRAQLAAEAVRHGLG